MEEIKISRFPAARIRGDFKGLQSKVDGEPVTYLDSAATTLKPETMVSAISDYYSGVSCNIHRGKHFAMEEISDAFEQVRYKVAKFIGCHGNEVIFVKNTTDAINMVAAGLELNKSDLVLASDNAHHSNLLPWSSRGTVAIIPSMQDGGVDLEQYAALLTRKPKVVALTHCSNVTGIYIDIEKMADMAKDAGALVVVDAAQSVPHRPVSVATGNIDFLCFSAHKMLGPTGLGVLFGKRDCLSELKPSELGGGMVDWVEYDSYRLRKIPHRFEAGTPNIAGVIGFGAALDYVTSIGMDNIAQHDKQMANYILEKAAQRSYLRVLHPDPALDRGALVSMTVEGLPELDDLSRYLSDSYGIIVRNGLLCAQPFIQSLTDQQVIRVSAYLYNIEQDIDYFFESLDSIVSFMTGNKAREITL